KTMRKELGEIFSALELVEVKPLPKTNVSKEIIKKKLIHAWSILETNRFHMSTYIIIGIEEVAIVIPIHAQTVSGGCHYARSRTPAKPPPVTARRTQLRTVSWRSSMPNTSP
ncbi:hypothetical protein LCGC14_3023710, partial [marine sediment metagenome]